MREAATPKPCNLPPNAQQAKPASPAYALWLFGEALPTPRDLLPPCHLSPFWLLLLLLLLPIHEP